MTLSILIAPLFFGVPLGCGILLLWRWRPEPSGVALVTALLLGVVVITRTFEVAERLYVLDQIYRALVRATVLLGVLGSLVGLIALRVCPPPRIAILLAALVAAPSYVYVFFWLSAFPFTDLFAEIHSMKLAEELARWHVFNNIDAASYIQMKPVLSAILISAFGYDILQGAWTIALWAAAFKLLVAWQASRLVSIHENSMLAFALLSSVLLSFEIGNSTFCAFGAITLMISLGDFSAKIENSWASAAAVLVLSACSLLFWRALNQDALAALLDLVGVGLGATIIAAVARTNAEKSLLLFALFIFVLIGCLVPLHRGSVLYIPIATGAAAIWRLRNVPSFLTAMAWLGRAGTIAAAAIPLLAIGLSVLSTRTSLSLDDAFFAIVKLLGGNISPELLLGLGVKNAVIEWGAATGIIFAALVACVFLFSVLSQDGRTLWKEPLFTLYWAPAAILTCFIVTGFPFAYRAMPFVCVFFALALSVALPRLWLQLRHPNYIAAAVPIVLGLAYAAIMMLPQFGAYTRFYPPLACALAIAGIATFVGSRRSMWTAGSVAVLLAFTLVADRLSIKLLLSTHSYGKPSSEISAISHYSKDEIYIANQMRMLPPSVMVVSDPFTTSIIRARTGLNAPYPYSNLDTLNTAAEQNLRSALKAASAGDQDGFCYSLAKMTLTAGEFDYLSKRLHQNTGEVTAVVVYSARTKAWQEAAPGQRGSYFPQENALDVPSKRRIDSMDNVFWSNETAIVPLTCGINGNRDGLYLSRSSVQPLTD
ncbi:hypothetical protein [Bradyrhizobium sp. 141]|uniref:hypothetical protein n=1 Tax=Bradyrhizobium sp. 141 TaxID=2782617 RepID=UPI001FFB14AF|nr:hypothetical protein [Bradyrhizobium sp. 141]MCK1718860.1 hypothetical protein [Bradyrhizobium sp. 141]